MVSAQRAIALSFLFLLTACGRQPAEADVHAYLLEHPEVVLDNPDIEAAIAAAAEARRLESRRIARQQIVDVNRELIRSPYTPRYDNANAEVAIIQFSDYQCVPCKRTFSELEAVKAARDDIDIVYLELPVYGSNSEIAARIAIAANVHGVFPAFHRDLMQSKTELTVKQIGLAAARAGMTSTQVEDGFTDPAIIEYLKAVRVLAEELEVIGTPTYLVGTEFMRGGMTAGDLNAAIDRQLSH